jgi:hypothetical protein
MGENKKVCSICGIEKELSKYYSQNKKKSNGDKYIYYNPECKECTKKRSESWIKSNNDKFKKSLKRYKAKEDVKLMQRDYNQKWRDKGGLRNWYHNNKERWNEIALYRKMHKEHDISEQEWDECKEFFNYSCAYCGMDEHFAKIEYDQGLNKEHVDHKGANDITNCVPACKGCNGRKWIYELNEWYNENNPIYSKRRYNKIIKWILSFTEEKVN